MLATIPIIILDELYERVFKFLDKSFLGREGNGIAPL